MMRRTLVAACAMVLLAFGLPTVKLVHDLPVLRVGLEAVTAGQLDAPILRTGTVRAANPVNVTGPVPGSVQSVEVTPGTVVHAGDVLARLDASAYTRTLDTARIELLQAEDDVHRRQGELGELERQCSTEEQLAAERIIALAELRATEAAVQQAGDRVRASEARVFRARETLAQASAGLQESVIRAPVGGLILSIAPDEPSFRIASDLDHVVVRTELAGRDSWAVQVGNRVAISTPRGPIDGTVVAIEQDESRPPSALIDVPASPRDLRPGTVVTLALDATRRGQAVRIPNAALSFAPSADLLDRIGEVRVPNVPLFPRAERAAHVWTYDGSSFATVEVRTGDHDALFTELLDGPLRPGDQVVTSASVPED